MLLLLIIFFTPFTSPLLIFSLQCTLDDTHFSCEKNRTVFKKIQNYVRDNER